MKKSAISLITLLLAVVPATARVARGGGGDSKVNVQNRSANPDRAANRANNAGANRANANTANASRANNANANRNNNANVNRNANVNQNANVNRNVNVNQNVNVNRDVNVNSNYHGSYYGGRGGVVVVEEDNDWNWGAFAAGTAVGVATTAAASAAAHSSAAAAAPVAAAPAVGTVVTSLPGSCVAATNGGTTVYNCNNTYYQPTYQGTTLVYQVVQM